MVAPLGPGADVPVECNAAPIRGLKTAFRIVSQPGRIGIVRGLAALGLGSRILRTPWLASASALSKSTWLDRVIWRWKAPKTLDASAIRGGR